MKGFIRLNIFFSETLVIPLGMKNELNRNITTLEIASLFLINTVFITITPLNENLQVIFTAIYDGVSYEYISKVKFIVL